MTIYNDQKDLKGDIFLCGYGFKQFAAYFCCKMWGSNQMKILSKTQL